MAVKDNPHILHDMPLHARYVVLIKFAKDSSHRGSYTVSLGMFQRIVIPSPSASTSPRRTAKLGLLEPKMNA
jgi:hypothetical protein